MLGSPAAAIEVRLKAGAAKIKITPTEPVWQAGYASRNRPSEGIAADLYARALAIHDGKAWTAIVAVDVIDFDPVSSMELKKLARKQYGLREERILLIGSHTHSGPEVSAWGTSAMPDPNKERTRKAFYDSLKPKILSVIGEAIRSASHATLEMARGQVRIGTYRRVKRDNGTWGFGADPSGPIDPDLPVMKVTGQDGKVRAVLFTHACHCTSITNGNEGFYLIHPDWAVCSSKLEERNPGATVLFLTGCGGDIDPTVRGPVAAAERNGETMANAIQAVLQSGSFRPVGKDGIGAKLKRIRLPLEKPDRAEFEKMVKEGNPDQRHFASERLREMDTGTLRTFVDYPIQVLRFGPDLTMICLSGEVCVEYALRIKKELGEANTWVVGYANEVVCYIPSERVLTENGYESGWSLATGRGIATTQMAWGGFPTPFAFGLEDRIVEAVKKLIGR